MKRFRTLLSVLLGLVLLLQGLAVSAAPHAKMADVAKAELTVKTDMPCHTQKADPAGQQDRSCCNADCPDMTSCALSHIATMAVMPLALPRAARAEPTFTQARAVAPTLTSPLRPPITSHG